MGKHTETLAEKLARMTVPEPNTGCMIFTGVWQSRGYGMVGHGGGSGERTLAHRAAWELKHGPIPEGMTIDHKCKVKACVNPDHMEVVTRKENTVRAHAGVLSRSCRRGHDMEDPTNLYLSTRANGKPQRCCKACHHLNSKAAQPARKS